MQPSDVVHFWFEELSPTAWWAKDAVLDARIETRFGDLLIRAAACELVSWRETAIGAVAEIIVLDQFSRNIHRDRAQAFAQDPLALALAQEAVRRGLDAELPPTQRHILYMPYMHSESRLVHDSALQLFSALGNPGVLDFERQHKAIIDRFGRYPHRNAVLGRLSTPEETAFLATPGSSF